jgi:uncharacterized membrane protein YkoI
MNTKHILIGLATVAVLVGSVFLLMPSESQKTDTIYFPTITPSEFSATVNNPYFTLVPGTKFTYEAKKPEGIERIEVTVLNETRVIMGVETRIVRDQVFLDGDLIEDTLDWYAQDKEGNVWYFGEETAEYENGVISSTHGAWEAGINGALPGIVMKAKPRVGDTYYQEYLKGEAEDKAEILAINETVAVPYGTFIGCIKTFDYTALDQNSLEHKYYCKETGWTTLEVDTKDDERTELIKVETDVQTPPASLTPSAQKPAGTSIKSSVIPPVSDGDSSVSDSTSVMIMSEKEARTIALQKVPGKVTAVEIGNRFGKQVYVVEVDADSGPETDVIIDMESGAVLDIEI